MKQNLQNISSKLRDLISDYHKVKLENKALKDQINELQNTSNQSINTKAVQQQIDDLILEVDACIKDLKQ